MSTFGGRLASCASQCLPSVRYIILVQIAPSPHFPLFFFFFFFPPHPALYIHPHLFSLCPHCRYSPSYKTYRSEQKKKSTSSVLPHLRSPHQYTLVHPHIHIDNVDTHLPFTMLSIPFRNMSPLFIITLFLSFLTTSVLSSKAQPPIQPYLAK